MGGPLLNLQEIEDFLIFSLGLILVKYEYNLNLNKPWKMLF